MKKTFKQITEEKAVQHVCSSPKIQTRGEGISIEDVMMGKACFSTAIQLGNSPTMQFGGKLSKYVQFITMFRNSFDKTIKDLVALYEILMRHIKGLQKELLSHAFLVNPL